MRQRNQKQETVDRDGDKTEEENRDRQLFPAGLRVSRIEGSKDRCHCPIHFFFLRGIFTRNKETPTTTKRNKKYIMKKGTRHYTTFSGR